MGPITSMANNFMEVLATVPATLATAWGVWLVAGVMLATWYHRARLAPVVAPAPSPSKVVVTRTKSASRSLSGVREAAPVAPVEDAPMVSAYEPPPGVAPVIPREKKPMVIGDPFGDLATLLDQAVASVAVAPPVAAPPPEPHRAPADSPILSSSGFPMRRSSDEPKLS